MGTQIEDYTPLQAVERIRLVERQLYNQLPRWINALTNDPNVSSSILTANYTHPVNTRRQINEFIAGTVGETQQERTDNLREGGKKYWIDETRDIIPEYQAMLSNLDDMIDWLDLNGQIGVTPAVVVDASGLLPIVEALKASMEKAP